MSLRYVIDFHVTRRTSAISYRLSGKTTGPASKGQDLACLAVGDWPYIYSETSVSKYQSTLRKTAQKSKDLIERSIFVKVKGVH